MNDNDKNNDIEMNDIEGMEETIVFTDDEGNEVEFAEIAYFEFEGNAYSALVPIEPEDESEKDAVYFCKVTDDADGFETLEMIDDDNLADKLFVEFLKLQEEEGCDCDCHDGCDCE